MKKDNSTKKALEIGAGIVAGVAGALAAGYLVYEKTKPHHAKIKAWVKTARTDAAKEIKKIKQVGVGEYGRLVEKTIKHYGAIHKASAPEIAKAIAEAKAEWKHIQAQAKTLGPKKSAVKAKASAAKKTVKKAVK